MLVSRPINVEDDRKKHNKIKFSTIFHKIEIIRIYYE